MTRSPSNILAAIREQRPLVLNLTNSVVQPLTANLLLAVGAVPAMLNDTQEIKDMLAVCTDALLINVGTLTHEQAHAMRVAAKEAKQRNIPWVLDPVAVGLLSLRTQACHDLMLSTPSLIRGNASEIMALAGQSAQGRGPESSDGSDAAVRSAIQLAQSTGNAVLVTGEVDYATDGKELFAIENGHEMLTRVTGMGCAMGALCGAAAAVTLNKLAAAVATAAIMGVAAELAMKQAQGPGSFASAMLDALYTLDGEKLSAMARIRQLDMP